MKKFIVFVLLLIGINGYGQDGEAISTVDFVQILYDNQAEALFYYENNWKPLRDTALAKGYITSYEMLETPFTEDAPFHLMLITTYADEEQFAKREEHFLPLVETSGGLKLLNDKQPDAFRKSVFVKEKSKVLVKGQ